MRSLLSRRAASPRRCSPAPFARPSVEALESRWNPVTFRIRNLEDSGFGSLRQAIEIAENNPLIRNVTIVFADTLNGIIELKTPLPDLTKDYEILGPPRNFTGLTLGGPPGAGEAGDPTRVIEISRDPLAAADFSGFTIAPLSVSSFSNITVMNMVAANGGAFMCTSFSTVTLDHVIMRNNLARTFGGAVDAFLADVTITDCQLYSNSALFGGAITNDSGNMVVSGETEIFLNYGELGGGIYNVFAGLAIQGPVKIHTNTAIGGGGIFNDLLGTISMVGGEISSNYADFGGGVYLFLSDMSVSSGQILMNQAQFGGGFFLDLGGFLYMEFSTLAGNQASDSGDGGLNAGGSYSFWQCLILDEIE